MIKTYITLDKAIANVEYFTTPNKKGKTKLDTCETGFTCYANSLHVVKDYACNGKLSVPTQAEKAQKVLDKLGGK
jgi:hypothetical protein